MVRPHDKDFHVFVIVCYRLYCLPGGPPMCTLYGICVRMCRSGLPVFVCYVLCVCICMYARTRLYMLLFAYLTVCSPNIYTCHVVYAPMALDVSVWFDYGTSLMSWLFVFREYPYGIKQCQCRFVYA